MPDRPDESAARWPDLAALPGVEEAVERARTAIAAVRRLPAHRRGWARTAAAAGIRAARASAVLDGGSGRVTDSEPDGIVTDPVLAGALRVSAAIGDLSAVWPRAPLQALARLHTLAAAGLVLGEALGRPRGASTGGVAGRTGERLALLAEVVRRSPWPGPIIVAVVHGELLALRPFGSADGVVARAAARLTMVTCGLDPQALTAPEVGYLRAGDRYRTAAHDFATGDPDGVAGWIRLVCEALHSGAAEARSIAAAAGDWREV